MFPFPGSPTPDGVPDGVPVNQTIERLEPNPRLVGIAETILQQNAAILQVNHMIIESILSNVLVMRTELVRSTDGDINET